MLASLSIYLSKFMDGTSSVVCIIFEHLGISYKIACTSSKDLDQSAHLQSAQFFQGQ